MERKISVRDIRQAVNEEKNEFKPVRCDKSYSDNKKNSDKVYKDTEKETGAKEVEVKHNLDDKLDGNRTTLDYELELYKTVVEVCGENV